MSNTDDVKIQKISKMLEIGGTMLAQHCNNCGAPLFRYQGRVLCPVCDDVRDPRGAMGQADDTAPVSSVENEVSSVNIKEEPVAAPSEPVPTPVMEPVRTEPSRPLVQGSVSELESLIISKMTSMAREMQDENDPRRIDEYLDLIERCMDILAKMQK